MDDDMTNPDPPLEPTAPDTPWPAPATTPQAATPTATTPPEGPPPAGPPPVPGAPPPAGEQPRSGPSWKTWVAVAAGAAVVGAAAVFGISAATSSGSSNAGASNQPSASSTPGAGAGRGEGFGRSFAGGGGVGTIASINGSDLTLKNGGGKTTKVVTSSKTAVTTSSSGTVGDVKVGDTVTVIGTGTSPAITATRVMDDGKVSADAGNGGPGGFAPPGGGEGRFRQGANGQAPDGQAPNPGQIPGGGQFPGANGASAFTRGTVASVGNGTFTVTSTDGTAVTVTTSSSTTVNVTRTASVSDLKVGDQVVVQGKRSNGTITATNIREGSVGGGFFGRNRPSGIPPTGNPQNGG